MAFTIAPAHDEDLRRAEELTVRTHQLNTTGYTYSYEELSEFSRSEKHKLLISSLDDKYGTYGKIGLVLVELGEEYWTVKLLLMSCRVISRGVGTIMINYIMQMAKQAGVRLRAEFVSNDRNRMMYITFDILPQAFARGFLSSLRGFPASLRLAWFGFHRARSYSLSTGEDGLSSRHNVFSSIDITIMMDATFRACPVTNIKRKGIENMPTVKAAFRGWVPLVDFDKIAPVPFGFVFQLGHKLTPSHITNRFGKFVILYHVLDLQTLNTDHLVFTYQFCRELLQEITAAISDASVGFGNFETGLCSVLGTLLFQGIPRVNAWGGCQ